MASTLFGASGGAIYMKKGLARAGVHIILARIVSKIKMNFFQIPFHIKTNAPPFWYSLGARLIRGLGDYHSLGYLKFHL